jgi:hypothetical protein
VARIPKRLPRDVNARAVAIARILTGDDDAAIDPRSIETITTAKRRARKGGTARTKALTPSRRSDIAKTAAATRWKK